MDTLSTVLLEMGMNIIGKLVVWFSLMQMVQLTNPLVVIQLFNNKRLHLNNYTSQEFPDVGKLFNIDPKDVQKLTVANTRIISIDPKSVGKLNNLETLQIENNKNLKRVEADTFVRNGNIHSMILSHNSISKISPKAFNGIFKDWQIRGTLHLEANAIRRLPRFEGTFPGLLKLSLDDNPLEELTREHVKGMSSLYFISATNTHLQQIGGRTFAGSPHLHHVRLNNNKHLSVVDDNTFEGTQLRILDLSNTNLDTLPSQGLNNLEELYISDMLRLHHLRDSIVGTPTLRKVRVGEQKGYLCCAFVMRRARLRTLQNKRMIDATLCPTMKPSTTKSPVRRGKKRRRNINEEDCDPFLGCSDGGGFDGGGRIATHPPNGSTICGNQHGEVHEDDYVEVDCTPAPDPMRPCDDILGTVGLTLLSWCVAVVGLLANMFVFVVISLSRRTAVVTKFLLQNLSLADLCLSLYLFILVCASTSTSGSYYNYVRRWQLGGGCAVQGFLAMFSSQLSVLVLFVITVERYFSIVFAMKFTLRLNIAKARWCIAMCWFISFIVALLPVLGVNSYTDVAICLPFRTRLVTDKVYIGVVMICNVFVFMAVLLSYLRMYYTIRNRAVHSNDTGGRAGDGEIAKRMALLVFTDFACWIPIAFVAMVSTFVGPRVLNMDLGKSKYLLVIFFPINAICNPILYAVSTTTFKKDIQDLKKSFFKTSHQEQTEEEKTRSRRLTSLSGLYQGLYKRLSSKLSKDDFTRFRIPLLATRMSAVDDSRPASAPVVRKDTSDPNKIKIFSQLLKDSEEHLKMDDTFASDVTCSKSPSLIGRLDHSHVTQCSSEVKKLPLVRVRSNSTGRIDRGAISPAFKEVTLDYEFSSEAFDTARETCGL